MSGDGAQRRRAAGLDHVIVTRFSIRGSGSTERRVGALDPARLAARFRMFEVTCLPSVRAQRCRDFRWVLAIDPALPARWRARLRRLLTGLPHAHVHAVQPTEDIRRLEWLAPCLRADAAYALTTVLDDDDALADDLVTCLQAQARRAVAAGVPLRLYGCSDVLEWDFVGVRRARLGWVKPRARAVPPSVAFSLLCRQPTYPFSVNRLNHSKAREYFAPTSEHSPAARKDPRFTSALEVLGRAAAAAGDDLGALGADAYEEIRTSGPGAVTLNHPDVVRFDRLITHLEHRAVVTGEASFPSVTVDLEAARRYIPRRRAVLRRVVRGLTQAPPDVLRALLLQSHARTLREELRYLRCLLEAAWRLR